MHLEIDIRCRDENYNQTMISVDTISAVISNRFDLLMGMEALHESIAELQGRSLAPLHERAAKHAANVEHWAREQFHYMTINLRSVGFSEGTG